MEIGARWLVVVAGMISTLASFIGGYLMYIEGLSALERTVEEVGRADAQAMDREVKRTFRGNADFQSRYRDVLMKYNSFATRDDFSDWLSAQGLADLYNGDTLQAIAIKALHRTNSSKDFQELLWIDHLQNAGRNYIYAKVLPDVPTPNCARPCVICYSLDPISGGKLANVYNFTDYDFPRVYMEANATMQPGNTTWYRPLLWFSSDNTPYVYIEYFTLMPLIPRGFLSDYNVFVGTDLSTFPFENFMVEYNTDATMILTQLDAGLDSLIIAANVPEGQISPTCRIAQKQVNSNAQPCLRTLRNLTNDQRDVVVAVNHTSDWTFKRHGNYWTLRSTIFSPRGFDKLQALYLVWFRSVSKVKKQMNQALFLFVGFLSGVLVFDILIGLSEIVLVARPLVRLARATEPLQEMCLEEAEKIATADMDQFVQIHEVVEMRKGLLFAIQSLREYKAYMPATLFVNSDSGSAVSNTQSPAGSDPSTRNSGHSMASSRIARQNQATSLGLLPSKMAAAFVGLVPDDQKSVRELPSGAVFSLIETKAKQTRGQLHGFVAVHFDTFLVTWAGFRRDDMATAFCMGMCTEEINVSLALTTSTGWMAGNTGTQTYRGFALQGKATENLLRSFAFASYASVRLGVCGVITPLTSARALSSAAVSVPVGQVLSGSDATFVSEVYAVKQCDIEEWMYVIDLTNMTKDAAPSLNEMLKKGACAFDLSMVPLVTALTRRMKEVAERASVPYDVYSIEYAPQRFAEVKS